MSQVVGYEDLDTSPVTWLVDGIIPQGPGVMFVWGQSWAGKSLVAIDMALNIGNGRPFMGRETARGRVVYLCGEGMKGIGRRAKARIMRQEADDTAAIAEVARTQGDEAARAYAAALPPYTGDNFKVMSGAFPMHFTPARKPTDELQDVMNDLLLMNTPQQSDIDPVTGEVRADFPYIELVILDSLENFSGELSISNRSSANRVTKAMHWMSEKLGCGVLAVAHPVADGSHMAGSNRLFATADVVIKIEPAEVAEGDKQAATVTCEKSKDDKGFPAFGYQVFGHYWDEPVLDDDDQPTGETEEVSSATVRLIEEEKPRGKADRPAAQPAAPPPVLRDPPPPPRRIRNGLKQRRRLHVVPDLPGTMPVPESVIARKAETSAILDARATPPAVVPPPGPASPKQELARALLEPRCPVCCRPGSMGCDPRMQPPPLPLARTAAGQSYIHKDRISEDQLIAAAIAATDPEAFMDEAIAWLAAAAAAPAAPARPVRARPGLAWTTVTPDGPAPTLAELGLAGH